MRHTRIWRSVLSLIGLVLLSAAAPAGAVDGVLEISQSCATQTGCFAGDAAGFPITISAEGSYRLTGNLTVSDPNLDGLVVTAAGVTVDFNGFALSGPATGSGSGSGVTGTGTDGADAIRSTFRNGTIRGFRSLAIALAGASQVRVDDMGIDSNAGGGLETGERGKLHGNNVSDNTGSAFTSGIVAGASSTVSGNVVTGNPGGGIQAGSNSLVSGNTISGASAGVGITAGDGTVVSDNSVTGSQGPGVSCALGCVIRGNAVYSNGGAGILESGQSTIAGNSSRENTLEGIHAGAAASISGNVVSSNGADGILAGDAASILDNSSSFNTGDGIEAGAGALVQRNAATQNVGFGVRLVASDAVYRNNVITGNTGGTVTGGVNLFSNSCNGTPNCP